MIAASAHIGEGVGGMGCGRWGAMTGVEGTSEHGSAEYATGIGCAERAGDSLNVMGTGESVGGVKVGWWAV